MANTKQCYRGTAILRSDFLLSEVVLTYPRFDKQASHFVLQTDASAIGLGAILQQDGNVIGYVSRVYPNLKPTIGSSNESVWHWCTE